MSEIPTCFISYSYDSKEHKEWFFALASRLMKNGVDIILDQRELRLGSDLLAFMEGGLSNDVAVML